MRAALNRVRKPVPRTEWPISEELSLTTARISLNPSEAKSLARATAALAVLQGGGDEGEGTVEWAGVCMSCTDMLYQRGLRGWAQGAGSVERAIDECGWLFVRVGDVCVCGVRGAGGCEVHSGAITANPTQAPAP